MRRKEESGGEGRMRGEDEKKEGEGRRTGEEEGRGGEEEERYKK